jgi:hypothetical protein
MYKLRDSHDKIIKQALKTSKGIPEHFLIDILSFLKDNGTDSSKIRKFIDYFSDISPNYEGEEYDGDLLQHLVSYVEKETFS